MGLRKFWFFDFRFIEFSLLLRWKSFEQLIRERGQYKENVGDK